MVQLTRLLPDAPGSVFAKLEMLNPGGSVKDRIGVAMIEAAEAEGRIEPGRTTIVEATSGNTGIALAFVCAAKGYDLILTLPQGMSREREGLLRLYGAQVHITESLGGMNEAVAAAQALARDADFWLPDQFSNPANPEAHCRGTGPELWEALDGDVDYLVAGVGTGGTITGAGRYLKERNPKLKVVGSSPPPRRCSPAGARGRTRSRASARASSRRCSTASLLDEVIAVDDEDALETARAGRAPRGRARRHLGRRGAAGALAVAQRGGRGGGSPWCSRTPASATSRRRSSRPSRPRRRAWPARGRGPPARRGSGRCTARSTASWSSPSCSPATRSAIRRGGRCGSTARPASSRRAGAERLRHPGLPRPGRHVGEPHAVRADDDRARSTRCSRAASARRRSWCSSTRGRPTAARSSSTRRAPGPTSTTCATRSCRSSTRATRRCRARDHRGLTGKSSGGYGAMVVPMLRPDVFGALASHAGDALFECCYLPNFPQLRAQAARRLRRLARRVLRARSQATGPARLERFENFEPDRLRGGLLARSRAARARRCCRSTSRPGG